MLPERKRHLDIYVFFLGTSCWSGRHFLSGNNEEMSKVVSAYFKVCPVIWKGIGEGRRPR